MNFRIILFISSIINMYKQISPYRQRRKTKEQKGRQAPALLLQVALNHLARRTVKQQQEDDDDEDDDDNDDEGE